MREDPSPVVADLYRSWYRQRGLFPDRLLAECFMVLEPWWALRTGSVPYWRTAWTTPSRTSALDRVSRVSRRERHE